MKQADFQTYFVGPPLEEGPLPAIFYFALSAQESLEKDPFNQPVRFLSKLPIRIFSITLPSHDEGIEPDDAMKHWEETKGREIPHFLERARGSFIHLLPFITRSAVMGLSRGAFIACHLAAICPEISHILGFAPLTTLPYAQELDVEALAPKLFSRSIRFYIGNHDIRVGTEAAFACIHTFAKEAHANRIRNAPLEMVIGPSTGYQGHGTLPPIFKRGAEWLYQELTS